MHRAFWGGLGVAVFFIGAVAYGQGLPLASRTRSSNVPLSGGYGIRSGSGPAGSATMRVTKTHRRKRRVSVHRKPSSFGTPRSTRITPARAL